MEIIKGNLITLHKQGEFDLIGHGCNCFNIMGNGIAAQIKSSFPNVFEMDESFYIMKGNINRLGCFSYSSTDKIANLYTQFLLGPCADLTAISLSLYKINHIFIGKHIGLPKIGCGLGGLNWKDVEPIIKKQLVDMKVTIVEL